MITLNEGIAGTIVRLNELAALISSQPAFNDYELSEGVVDMDLIQLHAKNTASDAERLESATRIAKTLGGKWFRRADGTWERLAKSALTGSRTRDWILHGVEPVKEKPLGDEIKL